MKLSLVSDSLSHLSLDALLDFAAAQGISGVEANTGNWSAAPHLDLAELLGSAPARAALRDAFDRRGLELVALNANGNHLHPTDGARQLAVVEGTIELAGLLGVRKVCLMSGLPGGGPGDLVPNWIVSSWPPEVAQALRWQWEDVLLPSWRTLADHARRNGVEQLCLELHGNQLVYNAPALLRLRREIGPCICANLDPSHLFWMGADPIAVIDELGVAIGHVHLKDTLINPPRQRIMGLLDNGAAAGVSGRSWSYATLGYGHGEEWWRAFCYRLRMAGYDGWLSIEHEDELLSREEGVRRSVAFIAGLMPVEPPDYRLQNVPG